MVFLVQLKVFEISSMLLPLRKFFIIKSCSFSDIFFGNVFIIPRLILLLDMFFFCEPQARVSQAKARKGKQIYKQIQDFENNHEILCRQNRIRLA